jgi:hypothetical protein
MNDTTEQKISEIVSLAKSQKDPDERVLDAVIRLLKEEDQGWLLELIEHHNRSREGFELSEAQKRELDERRARYERGEGRSYTWEETIRSVREGKE